MRCDNCNNPFSVGDLAYADCGKYHCQSCYNQTLYMNTPTPGIIAIDPIGNLCFVTGSGIVAHKRPAQAVGALCYHTSMGQHDPECPDCSASVTDHNCIACGHSYGSHSYGLKGPCVVSSCTCSHFDLPPQPLPVPAASVPIPSSICFHKNMSNYALTCPDCATMITGNTKCDNCQHEYFRHTLGRSGPCKFTGSSCPANCNGFQLAATLIPGVFPVVPPPPKFISTGTPLKTDMHISLAKSPVDIKAQRKKDGVCVECGDRGSFVNLACICNNGHGKIF